jgi:hypothetical protein
MNTRQEPASGGRGIALIFTLLAVVLLMTLIAAMVDIGTARLRRTTEDFRSLQALAAADAGAAWVRALLDKRSGDTSAMLSDLAAAGSTISVAIAPDTTALVQVSVWLPGPTKHPDHFDAQLQENPQIAEAPFQVGATATVLSGGRVVARRTVTTLLRSFHYFAPYSEIVGVIDDGGPSSVFSPGDPGGQIGGEYATDLRIRAFKEVGGTPVSADRFKDDSWSDGNPGTSGLLP